MSELINPLVPVINRAVQTAQRGPVARKGSGTGSGTVSSPPAPSGNGDSTGTDGDGYSTWPFRLNEDSLGSARAFLVVNGEEYDYGG